MGTLVPNTTFAGPTEPIWAYANSGSSATGPTGMKGSTGSTGSTGPIGTVSAGIVKNLILPPNEITNFALEAKFVGALITVSSDGSGGAGYDLNFSGPGTFPINATFFLKNVDNNVSPQPITIFYNSEFRGILFPPTSGVNNGFLCVAQVVAGADGLRIF